MLENLLRLIASQGNLCSDELARQLDVTPVLINVMLAELARQGYLERVGAGERQACQRCPVHQACLFNQQAVIWTLTAKGGRLLQQREENTDLSPDSLG